MNVICVICSDLLVQSDDVFYTRCGHVFHLQCLTTWLERSKSCPQCREKVTQSKIHRLYFTFSNNEVVDSSAASLQERIDSLKFQILLKEKDIKYFTSKNVTLEKQNAGLRKEVRKVESEINQKNSAIYALKEQTKYFKEQSRECDHLKKEITRLKNKLEELRPIQVLLHAPTKDVDEMVSKTRDPTTLITYISVMKKELLGTLSKCKQLRITIKRLQEELTKVSMESDSVLEEQSKRMKLEEELAFSESRSISLQKRVNELEEILGINKSNTTLEIQREKSTNNISSGSSLEEIPKTENNKIEKSCRNSTITVHRKEKVSAKDNRNIEESSSFQTESGESTSLEESLVICSPASDSSIPPKRPRMSIGREENGDTNNLNKSKSDSKGASHSAHSKSKKRRESNTSIKKYNDKYNDKNKDRNNSHVIDLT